MGQLPDNTSLHGEIGTIGSRDIAGRIARQMQKLQVQGLPRNYELFHEALSGHNPLLAQEILALPRAPVQSHLDQIGIKHRLVSHCGIVAERATEEATRVLAALREQLAAGVAQKESFSRALNLVTRSVREDGSRGIAQLLTEMDFLNASAQELVQCETALVDRLQAGLKLLEDADRVAQAARTIVLRDRLTQLANRIAFSNRLEEIYGTTQPTGMALVLVDIDQFRAIVLQYGEEDANKLLRRMAAIFRKSIKKNDLVARIGANEFAFLFADVNPEATRAIAERLHAAVENNVIFAAEDGAIPATLGLSIGYALCDTATSPQQLLTHGELALVAARSNRRTPVVGYSPELARTLRRRAA